jgi:hypothetical protein
LARGSVVHVRQNTGRDLCLNDREVHVPQRYPRPPSKAYWTKGQCSLTMRRPHYQSEELCGNIRRHLGLVIGAVGSQERAMEPSEACYFCGKSDREGGLSRGSSRRSAGVFTCRAVPGSRARNNHPRIRWCPREKNALEEAPSQVK